MEYLFINDTKESTTVLCACISRKGNVYFKVRKGYRDERFTTKESVNYFTLEEALKIYILWCGE